MSQAKAKTFLKEQVLKSDRSMLDQLEGITDDNQRAMSRAATGRLVGGVGLPLIALLAAGSGGLSLPMIAGLTLLGSRGGSEIGERWGGVEGVEERSEIDPTGFGATKRAEANIDLQDMYGQFDEGQTVQAFNDMMTAIAAGYIPASKGGSGLQTRYGIHGWGKGLDEGVMNLGQLIGQKLYPGKFLDSPDVDPTAIVDPAAVVAGPTTPVAGSGSGFMSRSTVNKPLSTWERMLTKLPDRLFGTG